MPRASTSDINKEVPKRKKGRSSVACYACRARKLACDLQSPCSTCIAKGEESMCSLANQLYYENLEDAPASKLRASVDRLEAMVLKKISSPGQPRQRRNHSFASSSSSPRATTSIYGSPSLSSTSSSPRISPIPNTLHDAEILSRLILGRNEVGKHVSPGINLASIISDLHLVDNTLRTSPLPQLAEPHSLQSSPSPTEFASLLLIMPTQAQAHRVSDSFFLRVDPLFHLVHRGKFESQLESIWLEEGGGLAMCDPHWLSTFLIICGNGLISMTEEECSSFGLPVGDGKGLLSRSWMDAGMQCLAYGNFDENPTTESIRAVVLLNQFWSSFGGGLHLNASISFNTSVVAAAIELNLHRDPDELLDFNFSPLEAEERRRIFYALFSIDTLTRALVGKAYAPLDPTTFTVRLPSNLPDEAFTTTGDFSSDFSLIPHSSFSLMTSVITIHQLCLVLSKITKVLASTSKPSGDKIRTLHQEIETVEADYITSLKQHSNLTELGTITGLAQLLIWFTYVKLHRSCLGSISLSQITTTEDLIWHRTVCLQHANSLISCYDQVHTFGPAAKFIGSSILCSAAITLSIDLLDSPYEASMDQTRIKLASLIQTIESNNGCSGGVCRRAATILRHLSLSSRATRVEDNITLIHPQPQRPFFLGGGGGGGGSSSSSTSDSYFPPHPFIQHSHSNTLDYDRNYNDPHLSIAPLADPHVSIPLATPNSEYPSVPAPFEESKLASGICLNDYQSFFNQKSMDKYTLKSPIGPPLLEPWLNSLFSQ